MQMMQICKWRYKKMIQIIHETNLVFTSKATGQVVMDKGEDTLKLVADDGIFFPKVDAQVQTASVRYSTNTRWETCCRTGPRAAGSRCDVLPRALGRSWSLSTQLWQRFRPRRNDPVFWNLQLDYRRGNVFDFVRFFDRLSWTEWRNLCQGT